MSAHESRNPQSYLKHQGPRALKVCREVATRARDYGLNPVEVVAVSWKESRHTKGKVGAAGEVGPLQAIPKYWKRKQDRDHITAGLRAWAYFRKKSKNSQEAAGKYNGAGSSSRYAEDVAALIDSLEMLVYVARWPRL